MKVTDIRLQFLQEEVGLKIDNVPLAREKLTDYGYEEICLQYLNHFGARTEKGDFKVQAGTTFNSLYDFYQLDQRLKNQTMVALQLFEQTFKNAFLQNVEFGSSTDLFKESFHLESGRIIRRGDVKSRLRHLKKNYIEPFPGYRKMHARVTPWVLLKEMSFGVATNCFFLLHHDNQQQILTAVFKQPLDLLHFERLLEPIDTFRHRAAHNYRLLGIKEDDQFLYAAVNRALVLLKNQDPSRLIEKKERSLIQDYLQKYPKEEYYLKENLAV